MLDHRRAHIPLVKQLLNGSDVVAIFQSIRGEGMAKGVRACRGQGRPETERPFRARYTPTDRKRALLQLEAVQAQLPTLGSRHDHILLFNKVGGSAKRNSSPIPVFTSLAAAESHIHEHRQNAAYDPETAA